MKIGILPLFNKGFIDNPAWCKPFLQTVDRIGVESVWTVEHPIVAEDHEHLYSYSEDGSAPFPSSIPLQALAPAGSDAASTSARAPSTCCQTAIASPA